MWIATEPLLTFDGLRIKPRPFHTREINKRPPVMCQGVAGLGKGVRSGPGGHAKLGAGESGRASGVAEERALQLHPRSCARPPHHSRPNRVSYIFDEHRVRTAPALSTLNPDRQSGIDLRA